MSGGGGGIGRRASSGQVGSEQNRSRYAWILSRAPGEGEGGGLGSVTLEVSMIDWGEYCGILEDVCRGGVVGRAVSFRGGVVM